MLSENRTSITDKAREFLGFNDEEVRALRERVVYLEERIKLYDDAIKEWENAADISEKYTNFLREEVVDVNIRFYRLKDLVAKYIETKKSKPLKDWYEDYRAGKYALESDKFDECAGTIELEDLIEEDDDVEIY